MTNGNDSAMPIWFEGNLGQMNSTGGLTKREHFAAIVQISNEEDDFSVEAVKLLMGIADIPKDKIEAIKFWDNYYAKRRVMKADALINQLNK